MTDPNNWNAQIIDEFRNNGGKVGGNFEGAPVTLLHHVGRKSGKQTVAPVMYLQADGDPDTIYVFASKAGAETHPAWYYNLTAAGSGTVEVGTETYPVEVSEVTGSDRDEVYAEQARRYPGFAEYEQKTAGIRTIPVLALRRAG
jgi:deazaflavin-dependent oxidoreductase (nitroreductase family)